MAKVKCAAEHNASARSKKEKKNELIAGYKIAAELNLEYAEMCFEADNQAFRLCEEKLSVICKRGEIFYADLSPVVGSEQGGIRPVLIVQNNIGNKYSPTVIVAAITSKMNKAKMPTHIEIDAKDYGLSKDSVILLEQIRTLDKRRLKEKIGVADKRVMDEVNEALAVSFGLSEI